jgi:hypothetical protein
MTRSGKHGSHRTGFPPLPLLLEIPSGFPHSHRFDDGIDISKQLQKQQIGWSCQHRKGLVTNVSGPQRNACPGTLIPQEGLVTLFFARSAERCFVLRVGVAGGKGPQRRGPEDGCSRRLEAGGASSATCPNVYLFMCALIRAAYFRCEWQAMPS